MTYGESTFGYGLAGGGMGMYQMCTGDDCDWLSKEYKRSYRGAPTDNRKRTCGADICGKEDAGDGS